METVKAVHAWLTETIAAYPTVTLYLWIGSLIVTTIGLAG